MLSVLDLNRMYSRGQHNIPQPQPKKTNPSIISPKVHNMFSNMYAISVDVVIISGGSCVIFAHAVRIA